MTLLALMTRRNARILGLLNALVWHFGYVYGQASPQLEMEQASVFSQQVIFY